MGAVLMGTPGAVDAAGDDAVLLLAGTVTSAPHVMDTATAPGTTADAAHVPEVNGVVVHAPHAASHTESVPAAAEVQVTE